MAAVTATKAGNWSDATVWSSNPSLPGAGDDVSLVSYAVVLDQDATVLSLTWTTGSLTVSGNRTLTTAVTMPNNTGYISIPATNTLNFVGNMTYTGTSWNGGGFRVSGILNHTGNLYSRIMGYLVLVAGGGVYNLTGDISTTGVLTNNGHNWVVVNTGGAMTMVGNIYLGWTLNYSYACLDISGSFTFTGSITLGQNTITDYYDTFVIAMKAGGTANITLNGLTLLTNVVGNDGNVFHATGVGTTMTINAVPITINKANFRLLSTKSSAVASYTGDVTISGTHGQVMFYALSSSQLTYSGTVSVTGAHSNAFFRADSSAVLVASGVFSVAVPTGGPYLCYTNGGTITLTSASDITFNPAAGNSWIAYSAGGTITVNANIVCSGTQSGGNGNRVVVANGASSIVNVNGNITQNGNWAYCVEAVTSGTVNVVGNITIGSAGQTYAVGASVSGVVNITGTVDCGGTVGNNVGLYALTLGSITLTGTLKRSGIMAAANSNTSFASIYQAGTGVITVNGSIEITAGSETWLSYVDLTKITWNPGASGHFTYLNWSFGGNDYPATNKVLAPTSFGFGAFTGTATDISGQVTAALTAQGLTPTRAAKLDYLTRMRASLM